MPGKHVRANVSPSVGGARFADTANAELSLRLPAPGSRSASLRANQSLEPSVMGLLPSSAWRNPIPAAQLRIRKDKK